MGQKLSNNNHVGQLEVTTLGGGCFWCIEAVFTEVRGVVKVESGYSGGTIADPTYQEVSTGTTGHAEVIQIRFDPNIISFKEILEIFFTSHNPTTINRQGADVGTQYRSAIFYHSEEQKTIAKQVIDEFTDRNVWDAPIVTQVEPFTAFFKAEGYHDKYFELHPDQVYCRLVIAPKIAKFRKQYPEKLKRV